jgi:type IV secretion system protein VirD4
LVTIWQSIAQLQATYGRQSDTILTNHKSKVFYSGQSDPAAFKYLAVVLGDIEIETRSQSRSRFGSRDTLQLATTKEPLTPAHMVRQMRPGHAVLIHGTLPPAHIQTRPWWAERTLNQRAHNQPPAHNPRPHR